MYSYGEVVERVSGPISQLILEKIDQGRFTKVDSFNYNYMPLRESDIFGGKILKTDDIAKFLEIGKVGMKNHWNPEVFIEERLEEFCSELTLKIRCDDIDGTICFEFDEDDETLFLAYVFTDK